jgi:hypothetical protein
MKWNASSTRLRNAVPRLIGSAVTGKNTSGDSSNNPSACALRYLLIIISIVYREDYVAYSSLSS